MPNQQQQITFNTTFTVSASELEKMGKNPSSEAIRAGAEEKKITRANRALQRKLNAWKRKQRATLSNFSHGGYVYSLKGSKVTCVATYNYVR